MTARLTVVGGGRMGEVLIGGLLQGGHRAGDIAVAEVVPSRRAELAAAFPGVTVDASTAGAARGASVVVVAVKPGDVAAALDEVAGAVTLDTLVLSIAAGVTIASIEAHLVGQPVVRAMPNTPALVRKGVTAIAAGTSATADHLDRAAAILEAVGIVVRVPERHLDAVTGLSGSGPAYVFLVVEALIEAGVLNGLPRDVATTLTIETLLGSAVLLAQGPDGPEALRAAVTSPGGTTAAGLRALESHAVRAAFLDAVSAATERSRQLGTGT